ncbi:hypothetical protein [Ruegeria sp. SCP11]|uniref:hypothetical protein n=1 Tax=Ruegeria sp. SCP11 TaxID=3141378 RepID=UPI003334DDA9
MTDKVVRTGIEDVLSSIKRLVNEEGRKSKAVQSTTITRKPGRLVLTDALRVGEDAGVEDPTHFPKEEAPYRVEDSVKPMILRACDIVQHAEPADAQQPHPAPKSDPVGSLSAKIEALETAIAKTEDQWEPDGDSDDEYAGTPNGTLVWGAEEEFALIDSKPPVATDSTVEKKSVQEEPEPAPIATFVRSPRQASAEEPKLDEGKVKTASLTLDEDMLRSLIAQVVREELQGVLGQRITRNVRKMVRREIYRALAEQKLD